MKLPEVTALLEQLRCVFPADKRSDRVFARIVASEVFGMGGGYFLLIKVDESDWKLTPKILDIIRRRNLAVKPLADYWVIYSPERG